MAGKKPSKSLEQENKIPSARLERIWRGMALPSWLKLFRRDHFFLAPNRVLWWLRETLENGMHNKYTLDAKGFWLSRSSCIKYGRGHLYAKICFFPHEGDCSIFIEDIWVSRPGEKLGSLMMFLFIRFLKEWDSVLMVKSVSGELSALDEMDPVNAERRNNLFRKFGFELDSDKRRIKASLSSLHCYFPKDFQELDTEDLVRQACESLRTELARN